MAREFTKAWPENPGADGRDAQSYYHRSGVTFAPAERLELQIGELPNRGERPAARAWMHLELMAASLSEVCEEIIRLAPTLVSIERERITTRLDQVICDWFKHPSILNRWTIWARRIYCLRHVLEAFLESHIRQTDWKPILKALTEPLAALTQDINSNLDAAGEGDAESRSLVASHEGFIHKVNQSRQLYR